MSVADLVLSRDPARRPHRLRRAAPTPRRRLRRRAPTHPDLHRERQPGAVATALADRVASLRARNSRTPGDLEQDTVEAGVDLIDRLESEIATAMRRDDSARSGARTDRSRTPRGPASERARRPTRPAAATARKPGLPHPDDRHRRRLRASRPSSSRWRSSRPAIACSAWRRRGCASSPSRRS